ncbi:hypothetical protein FSP39_023866 [Pinctada imbricata]|uniref:DDE Tnp4 domain-containing protein n=1 Tax=Pinctada imbricata TaxID=66713 RepID=A0AA88YXU3_PINIB|nr:hypothetical protein FSP39_023866 [Pinctada imbricata]
MNCSNVSEESVLCRACLARCLRLMAKSSGTTNALANAPPVFKFSPPSLPSALPVSYIINQEKAPDVLCQHPRVPVLNPDSITHPSSTQTSHKLQVQPLQGCESSFTFSYPSCPNDNATIDKQASMPKHSATATSSTTAPDTDKSELKQLPLTTSSCDFPPTSVPPLSTHQPMSTVAISSTCSFSCVGMRENVGMSDEKQTKLEGMSLITTHSRCIICKQPVTKDCTVIPSNAKVDLIINYHICAGPKTRICKSHLQGSRLKSPLDVCKSTSKQNCLLDKEKSDLLLKELLSFLRSEHDSPRLNFDDPLLSDNDFLVWTGWTKEQFEHMLRHVTLRDSTNRSSVNALAIFWIKLRTNLSYREIAVLFNISSDYNGLMSISRTLHSVAAQLNTNFVPSYLGIKHISREEAISHMTVFSNVLFENKLSVVWDGTYYYIEKSGDYSFSRRSYSGQKKRPLLKFMSIVFPDGYVVDSIGPYLSDGRNNDAGMTTHIMTLNDELKDWLQEGDVCVVDRGFRDVLDVFEEMGLETRMPSFLGKGESQHSIEEANQSRLVTKVRWVVEAYHGRVKKFKFFNDVIDNSFIPIIGQLNRIVTAALNAFRPPLYKEAEDDLAIAQKMVQSSKVRQNLLADRVKSGTLSSRGRWTPINEVDNSFRFPRLSEEYLRSLTCGVYQLKQASSYTKEHLDDYGDYSFDIHHLAEGMIRVRIQSRHISAKRYFLWIEFDFSDVNEPIKAYYCQCKAGMRTVGCCAHVASVLWYLGYKRHSDKPILKRRRVSPMVLNASDI